MPRNASGRQLPDTNTVRLVAGALAALVVLVATRPGLPLPATVLAAVAGGLLAGGCDLVVMDYARLCRRAYSAITLRPGLSGPLWLATWVFYCAILLFLVPTIVRPAKTLVQYDQATVLVVAAVILAILPLLFRGAARVGSFFQRRPRRAWAAFLLLVGAAFAVVQIAIGGAVRVDPGWDAGVVLDTATALSEGRRYDFAEGYYAQYPNNLMLTWLYWVYFAGLGVFGVTDTLMAAIVLHSVLMSASVILVASVGRRIAGRATAVFFLLLAFLFVALGGWNGVPYSDTVGMFFPAAVLWLVIVARGLRLGAQLALWSLAAAITAVGIQIKPTALFALVAACAVVVLWKGNRGGRRRVLAGLATAAAAAAVLLAGTLTAQRALLDASIVEEDLHSNTKQAPMTHFLKLGSTGLGGFQQQDVWETRGIKDPQARFQNGIDVYLERVREMGPIGYAQQIVTKMSWSVGDGSFFAWAEGRTHLNTDFPATDPASAVIRDYFTAPGEDSLVIRTLWQAAWLVVLALVVAPMALRSRTLVSPTATMMRVSLLALIVFLSLFENRARYLYLYVPYFLLLASLTVSSAAAMARTGSADRFRQRPGLMLRQDDPPSAVRTTADQPDEAESELLVLEAGAHR
jgi:hypothetical protein